MHHPDEVELAAFLAGELPPPADARVGGHLDDCPSCRAVAERLTAVPPDVAASLVVAAGARPAEDAPPAGPRLPGYADLRELGRGGSGVVYRARDLATGDLVAVKVLRGGVFATAAERGGFLAEAEAASRLRHPNITPVTAFGGRDAVPYFVMEYAFGGSLAGRLDGTPLPPEAAGRLVEAVARAVQFAHDAGVIHRDLKPGNILLGDGPDPFAQPKVADFGAAKLAGGGPPVTPTQAVLGTPSYMAPEQAFGRSRQVGPAADVYSLGAVLYELLTGRPPFKGETPYETLLQVRTLPLVWPRSLRPDTPRALEAVCLKCLERDPRRRYPTAAALADDLGRFLGGGTVQARPPRTARRLGRWAEANPAAARMAAALACTLLACVAALAALWLHAEGQRRHAEASAEAAVRSRVAARRTLALYARTTVRFFRTPESMTADEVDSLRRANTEAEEVLSAPTGDAQEEGDAAYALLQLADGLLLARDPDAAERLCRTGVGVLRRLSEADPAETRFAFRYSQGCSQLSGTLAATGGGVESEAMAREAVRVGEGVLARKPASDDCGGALANYRTQLAVILMGRGDYAAAEPLLAAALTESRRLCAKFPSDPLWWTFARATRHAHAEFLFGRDRSIDGLVDSTRFGLAMARSNRASYPLPDWSRVLAPAVATANAVAALDHCGRRGEADDLTAEGLAVAEAIAAEAPNDLSAKLALADQLTARGRRRHAHDPEGACGLFRRAAAAYEELQATGLAGVADARRLEAWATCPDPRLRDAARAVALARRDPKLRHWLGVALYADGKFDEAHAALAAPPPGGPSESRHARRRAYLVLTLSRLGEDAAARRELDALTGDLRSAARVAWPELPDWAAAWEAVHRTAPPVLWQKQ